MAQEWAESFYQSKKWKRCKQSYKDQRQLIDGGLCEECHEQLGFIVHHKILLTPANITDPEVSLNHDNLEFVCKDCHDRFDGHGVRHRNKSVMVLFDDNGMPIGRIDEKNN